ncbi:MAG TPA: hypothetical protein VIG40_06425, partial [Tissierellaceae bacterium]
VSCSKDDVKEDTNKDVDNNVEEKDVSASGKVYQGFGMSNLYREDMGEDSEGNPIYSFNQIFVNALFDEDDKIVDIYIDQLEVGTPNGPDTFAKFNGYPEKEGFNWSGKYETTEEIFKEELENWKTKRQLKDDYKLDSGTWEEQIQKYEETFKGMTVKEVIKWTNDYCSSIDNRPVTKDSEHLIDVEKYEALSEEDKKMLDDLTSVATISLNDTHGNILIAIRNASNNKKEVEVKDYENLGIGLAYNTRVMPMKDDEGNSIYSINEVITNIVLDKDEKISAIFIDQQELFSGNIEGDNVSRFSGFPTQQGYNGVEEITPAMFREEVAAWRTKRQLKDDYKLESGTWEEQILKIEEELIGKTKEEVISWAEEYENNPDLISGATISIQNENGMILDSIINSFDNLK